MVSASGRSWGEHKGSCQREQSLTCLSYAECSRDYKEREFPQIDRELKKMGPPADDDHGLFSSPQGGIEGGFCEPNEKEGRRLLAEIMRGGNFGQYDNRDVALKNGGMMKHGVWKLKRVMRLVRSYPEEALWEPVFRVWHLVWRGMNG